jgi:hypothetical protein
MPIPTCSSESASQQSNGGATYGKLLHGLSGRKRETSGLTFCPEEALVSKLLFTPSYIPVIVRRRKALRRQLTVNEG